MSSTRTALARQYRPRKFGEIAMQEHVSETLRTAVAGGRVAHAYLFAGPRGVGKTTAARVLAMALNCPDRAEDGEPCSVCESCTRIWHGRTSLDVIEIDAATNRGVDDARELRERAMYAPTDEHRFKVYIIDEAHMLTREAWNALLKILEEPPPRVIFVFATTEPQKIQQAAPPILSRCQRFDFRRIGVSGIVERLRHVLAAEGVAADEEALLPIARRAEGGLRDALSLLDQVLSFSPDRVAAEDVRRVLGLVGDELYLELFDILAGRRYGDVFRFVQRLLDDGYDLAEFQRGLGDAIRTLLICRLENGDDALDGVVREDLRPAFLAAAREWQVGDLLRMLAHTVELDADGRFRKSGNPRIVLEAMLLRFAHLDRTVELEALIRGAAGSGRQGDTDGPDAGRPGAGAVAERPRRTVPGGGRPAASAAAAGGPPAGAAAAQQRPRDTGRSAAEGPPEGPPVGPPEGPAAGQRPPDTVRGAAQPEPAAAGAIGAFRALLAGGEGVPAGLGPFLKAARVGEGAGDSLVLELPAGPALERLGAEPLLRQALEAGLARHAGRPIRLEVRRAGAADEPAAPRLTPEALKQEQLARLKREEPVLGRAVEEWDLELLD
jgi:DNA polymerase III subunit gamma/tau